MAKPIYYVWQDQYSDLELVNKKIEKFSKAGFEVIVMVNPTGGTDIGVGLLNILNNHR